MSIGSPYTPSYPGFTCIFPALFRIIHGASSGFAFVSSSSGTFKRILYSFPNFSIKGLYSFHTAFVATPFFLNCDMRSDSGIIVLYFCIFSLYPSFLSASCSTLLSTPIVSGLWHFGQRLFTFCVSFGSRLTLQFLCPSMWYFP